MSTSEKFCNDFIEIWNNNLGEFAKNYWSVGQRDCRVYVLHDDKKILQKIYPTLPPYRIYCFYTVFNGPVCDVDHWECFEECSRYVEQKIGSTIDFELNINTFMECWNEHLDEFKERLANKHKRSIFDQMYYDIGDKHEHIFVVRDKDLAMFGMTQKLYKCFCRVFNGTVCDEEHWKYFAYCLDIMKKATEFKKEGFFFMDKYKKDIRLTTGLFFGLSGL